MIIHKEGFKIILIALLLIILVNFIIRYIARGNVYVIISSIIVSAIFFSLIIWFFRKPIRDIDIDQNKIVSPADGKVVVIEKVFEKDYFKEERLQVSIFMSPLNVHVNYCPVSGKIVRNEYHKGDYLVAWHPKSSEKNERSIIIIEREDGTKILVKQIAGAVARRIVTYPEEGQKVKQGEELGFIKFGSRVDLLIPLNAKINVKVNDKVKGNLSVISTL